MAEMMNLVRNLQDKLLRHLPYHCRTPQPANCAHKSIENRNTTLHVQFKIMKTSQRPRHHANSAIVLFQARRVVCIGLVRPQQYNNGGGVHLREELTLSNAINFSSQDDDAIETRRKKTEEIVPIAPHFNYS